jgi:hypothetical protein
MLDATQESVQSALKRARATVDSHLADSGSSRPARQPDTTAERRLVAQLAAALERADLDALVGLLADDVRVHVVTIAGDRITAVTGFTASVMPRFGLPRTLPGTD